MALRSKRDKEKFVDGGFSFVFDKLSRDGDTRFWRCEQKHDGCKARLYTQLNEVVQRSGAHIHDGNGARVEVQRVITAMKRRAVDTQETTAQIVNSSIVNLSQAAQGQFPPIHDAFNALNDVIPVELEPVLTYFEDTYIGHPRGGNQARRRPIFTPEVWSVYQRTLDGDPRTNNHAEAAHRRIQCEMGMDHPTVWKFIDGLRRVQKGRETFYEGLVRGDPAPHKRRKYVLADERILHIVQGYAQRNIIDYLRGLAHNFMMNQ